MKKKRTILFITERRADYSRLMPIMRQVKKSKELKMFLVITGAHLLKEFGETKKMIEKDGFTVDAAIPVFTSRDGDDGRTMLKAFGNIIIKLTDIVHKLKPDMIFCGFDLGAHLATAIVGVHLNIPVAHIQGGERSGTVDEILRHAITKFSHMHFVATEESKKRIIKLGEDPKYIFLVGSPSIDSIKGISYSSRKEIMEKYKLDPRKPLVLFSQHPVTTEIGLVTKQIRESIKALSYLQRKNDIQILAIYSNNDAGGKRIVKELEDSNFLVFPHIAFEDYLRLMKVADALVGNSSAGIHEAPSFGLPTVNIGSRQQYRERGINVIDAPCNSGLILKAVKKCLFDEHFRTRVKHGKNPYDFGNTAEKIVKILKTVKLPSVQKVITY